MMQEQQKLFQRLSEKQFSSQVSEPAPSKQGPGKDRKIGPCYNYKKYGHLQRSCPQWKQQRQQRQGYTTPMSSHPAPSGYVVGASVSPQSGYSGIGGPPVPLTACPTPQVMYSAPANPGSSNQTQVLHGFPTKGQTFSIGVNNSLEPQAELVSMTVGARPVERVSIGGAKFDRLVGSGSQISALSESLYYEQLEPRRISLVDIDWLQVNAANGSTMPYIGLIVVDISVDGTRLADRGILVSKDTAATLEGRERVPGLLGMNILRDAPKNSDLAPPDPNRDQKSGFVRIAGTQAVILPPPCSISEIQVLVPKYSHTAVVEPLNNLIRCGARVATSCIETNKGKIRVPITNFTEKCL